MPPQQRDEAVAEGGQRNDVDLEHPLDFRPFARLEGAGITEPGVVDQEVEFHAVFDQSRAEGFHLRGVGKVHRDVLDPEGRVDFQQFGAQRFEPVRAPGDEDQRAGQRRELTSDFAADASGSARDERRAFEKIFHGSGIGSRPAGDAQF